MLVTIQNKLSGEKKTLFHSSFSSLQKESVFQDDGKNMTEILMLIEILHHTA